MAIINLKHRLTALATWALALALAFGAALPQPAQAIGPEPSSYAQMNHRPVQMHHIPDMSFQASSHNSSPHYTSTPTYSINGCNNPLLPCYHENSEEAPPGTCLVEWSVSLTYGASGAAIGTMAGAAAGASGGPPASLALGAAFGLMGGTAGLGYGRYRGNQMITVYHNSDGHHSDYQSSHEETSKGKHWECGDD